VSAEDLEAFRSSGFAALARWECASINTRWAGDQSDRTRKRGIADTEVYPGSVDKTVKEKAICQYQLAYL